ncbi:hypothetical protein [Nocardia niwae]|uniref:hypothetical protein n=1 Tax=Nocardia niwae TaxID=626084 RepID=UPI0033F1C943
MLGYGRGAEMPIRLHEVVEHVRANPFGFDSDPDTPVCSGYYAQLRGALAGTSPGYSIDLRWRNPQDNRRERRIKYPARPIATRLRVLQTLAHARPCRIAATPPRPVGRLRVSRQTRWVFSVATRRYRAALQHAGERDAQSRNGRRLGDVDLLAQAGVLEMVGGSGENPVRRSERQVREARGADLGRRRLLE